MLHVKYCTSTCLFHVHVECELLSGVYQETCNQSVDKVEHIQGTIVVHANKEKDNKHI